VTDSDQVTVSYRREGPPCHRDCLAWVLTSLRRATWGVATWVFGVGVAFSLGLGRVGVVLLRLRVADLAGPSRWRLTEAVGGWFVADHDAVLDLGEWQYKAFTNLGGYLRWTAVPDRRLASEAERARPATWRSARISFVRPRTRWRWPQSLVL
jgi:hypothetical protein